MNKIKEWLQSHTKQAIAIAVAIVLIIAFAVAGVAGAFSKDSEPEAEISTTGLETPETIIDEIELNVTGDDKWTAESSPAIVHIKGVNDNTKETDFYHAVSYGKEEPKLSLVSEEYEITVVAPINTDGSIHVLANANKDTDGDGENDALAFNSADYANVKTEKEQLKVEITIKQIPADQVTDDMMKEVVTNIKTAIAKGDDTLKGDNGKQILETVNKNVDANEHISDETKESTKETTESAQSETESKPTETVKPDNTGNKPNNDKPAPKDPVWVPEKGHYEDIVEQVWVPNIVTVVVTPERTEQVYDYSTYVFSYDGYTTTSKSDCKAHAVALAMQDVDSNYSVQDHYKTVTTPAVTKQEDQGSYQNKVTGQKWVVDVPGHWE